ncbi:MAG: ribosome assembly cofactor RimP [Bacteroidetes bacterium]|nr:ribosome assembly cofactor RimP [Bacteroidota bacterium]MBU1719421.1 ribosome assembly cofactor RimP [Bacteroidota bacterium]
MIQKNTIRKILDEKFENTDFFIVKVSIRGGDNISVYIDRDSTLAIGDCIEVSRYLERALDREKQDFELIVSSPGLTQPLIHERQYAKCIGKDVTVLLKSGLKKSGKLLGISNNVVSIEETIEIKNPKGKKEINQIKNEYSLDDIKETTLSLTF